ncbi:hypothetical protein EW146_g354 [Bondarzewia mesenterica]|uniref:Uncharacterized protein n=1 Tax=Bondarzewia mesenterica TaxID=1095465 RepID=A0A4S4MDM6_9AGAM|nr:hypothetical protein EW146_g354 [Bondarzewia mesenterica]
MSSYYERHRKERLDYQHRYNAVKRQIGRRKISKQARETAEKSIRQKQKENRLSYTNSIVCRSTGSEQDSERTPVMAAQEESLMSRCLTLQDEVKKSNPSDWSAQYIHNLQYLLNKHLSLARIDIQHPTMNGDDFRVQLHGHRRLIAGLHQQLEFMSQGTHVYGLAAEDDALVFAGRRVNKVVFRKLFGF